MAFLCYYLVAVNVLAFLAYGIDKLKARHHWWRIPEWFLLLTAVIGGSIGAFFAMRCFHHKTKKPAFRFGVPAIFIIQVVILYFCALSTLS